MTRWRWTGIALLGALVLLLAIVAWSTNTQSGTRWLIGVVSGVLNEQLKVDAVQGTVRGPLSLRGLRYRNAVSGLEISARAIDVDLRLRALLRATVQVDSANLEGLKVTLSDQPPEDDEPFSLDPPIDIVIERLSASDVSVYRAGESLLVVTRAQAAASWTSAGIAISRFDMESPQGEVHFNGRVQQQQVLVGTGEGRFRWRAGELEYAGTIYANTADATATSPPADIVVQMSSPLNAKLDATIMQTPALSWTVALDIPEFDPRESLLQDSTLTSIAVRLTGKGTLEQADLAGQVNIDGETVTLDSLRLVRNEQNINVASVLSLANGHLNANGKVFPNQAPARAELALDWSDLDIPAQWAGQVLHTKGRVNFSGSSNDYVANGALSLGPDRRIANIELDIKGSAQALQLNRLDVVQPTGRLASTGALTLKPNLAWNISATARQFDPGAFLAAWPGDLSFDLKSSGELVDQGPTATLALNNLRGRLRNRALTGSADLTLKPGMLLAGVLDIRSGGSQVHIDGQGDDSAMNAVATVQIETLADWIPNASGTLQARIAATGRWPEVDITARGRGNALRMADMSADSLSLDLNMSHPRQPTGSATIALNNIAAAGFRFDTFNATVDGAAATHRLTLRATGNPLAIDFALQGSWEREAWDATIQQLVIDLKNTTRLSLQEPARIHYAANAVNVSQSCFADRDIRLCLAGNLASDGAMQANYSLQHVPLSLANALAPGALPIAIDGNLEGDGEIRRSAQGAMTGHARLSAPAGKVTQTGGSATDTPALLTYENLQFVADLNGTAAAVKINATLDRNGSLAGELAIDGLGTTATSLQGQAQASLPSIAVIEVVVPQLADVHGRLDLKASITGTLQQPQITGSLDVVELAADVPELGLKLRNGRLSAAPRADGQFALSGGVDSGSGKLRFEGVASTAGSVQLDIQGERFLAADIPGAHVLITPDLDFVRTAQQMSLTGKVVVPEATVNLQKLPRGTRVQRASSDVVVIESETQEQTQAQAIPLVAEINVVLGDKVALTGFGLEATVGGQLLVRERPGAPTTGSGEIRVAGTYKAYGQDLTVQQGQILYAGTPLDNPRLNIVAVRTVGEVNAGLRVTGSAQNPQLTVFSDPPMGQANALSYLVAGKPLEEVGSKEGEADALQTAARSLGTAAGGLLAKKVGGRLGVDEVGIKDSEAIGGSAFTVGQYLSPRLYLSYGIGLFQPGEVVTLRYKLKESLALQAQRGPKDTRAGVEYRIEK